MLSAETNAGTQNGGTACAIDKGPCVTELESGMRVTLDVSPRPVEFMKIQKFRVTMNIGSKPVTDAVGAIDLTMPGMRMSRNRIKLVNKGDGTYEGEGVFVRCSSDLKWKAEILIARPAGVPPMKEPVSFTFTIGGS